MAYRSAFRTRLQIIYSVTLHTGFNKGVFYFQNTILSLFERIRNIRPSLRLFNKLPNDQQTCYTEFHQNCTTNVESKYMYKHMCALN